MLFTFVIFDILTDGWANDAQWKSQHSIYSIGPNFFVRNWLINFLVVRPWFVISFFAENLYVQI